MDTPEKIKTMAYYDVVNFAKLIKADTYITWGFNDDTCPPTTSYIVYNVLNCPKEALITPIMSIGPLTIRSMDICFG
jgi:cephalosporin-C deacetylase-like acetyl esterase